MPDSLPLARRLRPGDHRSLPGAPSKNEQVSANNVIIGAQHLDVPPRDVDRLLTRHGTSLPCYLDAQRWRDIEASHARWPHLWARPPKLPGASS